MVLAPLLVAVDPRQVSGALRAVLSHAGLMARRVATASRATIVRRAGALIAPASRVATLDDLDAHLQQDLGLRDCRTPDRIPGRRADWI